MQLVIEIDSYVLEHCKRHVREHYANNIEEIVAKSVPLDDVLNKTLEDEFDKIRAEIEQRPYGIANDSVIQGMKYERVAVLKIFDKYKAEMEREE